MLKNLPEQYDITRRDRLRDHIDASKINVATAEDSPVPLDQLWDHIASHIGTAGWPNTLANVEIAAAEVGYPRGWMAR
jgi:hypothetical protein